MIKETENLKPDVEDADSNCCAPGRDTSLYGGQAVLEGVMMKGKHRAVVACRNPKGEIVSKVLMDDPEGKAAVGVRRLPFIRGFFVLIDSLSLGLRALTFSAEVAMPEEEPEDEKPEGGETESGESKAE